VDVSSGEWWAWVTTVDNIGVCVCVCVHRRWSWPMSEGTNLVFTTVMHAIWGWLQENYEFYLAS